MVSYWIRARLEGSRMDAKLMKQFNYVVAKDQKIKLLAKNKYVDTKDNLVMKKDLCVCSYLFIYLQADEYMHIYTHY